MNVETFLLTWLMFNIVREGERGGKRITLWL